MTERSERPCSYVSVCCVVVFFDGLCQGYFQFSDISQNCLIGDLSTDFCAFLKSDFRFKRYTPRFHVYTPYPMHACGEICTLTPRASILLFVWNLTRQIGLQPPTAIVLDELFRKHLTILIVFLEYIFLCISKYREFYDNIII